MTMCRDMELQFAVLRLYEQASALDPAAVHIPPLFLADWLEDRGIPAEPLREYARRSEQTPHVPYPSADFTPTITSHTATP